MLDAATCLLPNNTWFFKGVAHVNFWYYSQVTKFLAGLITNPKKSSLFKIVKALTGNGQFVNTDENKTLYPLAPARAANGRCQVYKAHQSQEHRD